jgi:hypothetical protein
MGYADKWVHDRGPHSDEDSGMSNEAIDRQQQKINEFLRLLPLTTEIAGLPHCELGRHFNEDQMNVRANTMRTAYKVARQLIVEIASK